MRFITFNWVSPPVLVRYRWNGIFMLRIHCAHLCSFVAAIWCASELRGGERGGFTIERLQYATWCAFDACMKLITVIRQSRRDDKILTIEMRRRVVCVDCASAHFNTVDSHMMHAANARTPSTCLGEEMVLADRFGNTRARAHVAACTHRASRACNECQHE